MFQVMSPLSNGHGVASDAHQSSANGVSAVRRGSDVHMGGVDDDTQPFQDVPQMQPPPLSARRSGVETASGVMVAATQVSQRSAVTSVPPGVSPSAILNDTSTTKTSDPS